MGRNTLSNRGFIELLDVYWFHLLALSRQQMSHYVQQLTLISKQFHNKCSSAVRYLWFLLHPLTRISDMWVASVFVVQIERWSYFANLGWVCCRGLTDIRARRSSELEMNSLILVKMRHFWKEEELYSNVCAHSSCFVRALKQMKVLQEYVANWVEWTVCICVTACLSRTDTCTQMSAFFSTPWTKGNASLSCVLVVCCYVCVCVWRKGGASTFDLTSSNWIKCDGSGEDMKNVFDEFLFIILRKKSCLDQNFIDPTDSWWEHRRHLSFGV